MLGELKLMLIKDLKSAIRARWYILAVEILLTLIFIPAIWYSLGQNTDNFIDPYSQETINNFLNGAESSSNNVPRSIRYQK